MTSDPESDLGKKRIYPFGIYAFDQKQPLVSEHYYHLFKENEIITTSPVVLQQHIECLQTTTTATSLPAGGVRGDGGDILDAANLHGRTSQSPQGGLSSGSGSLGLVSTSRAQLDVQSGDSQNLAPLGNILKRGNGGERKLINIVSSRIDLIRD